MTIEIGFSNPYIPLVASEEGEPERASLSTLDDDERSHVHGTLWIRVNGRELPALGYFGRDDACLGGWAAELHAAARTMESTDPATYIFDEGEQGQPAFVFEREGPIVRVSLRPSHYGTAGHAPPWRPETCALADFVAEVKAFVTSLDATIRTATPAGANWVQEKLKEAG
jgi:hypothetical protein